MLKKKSIVLLLLVAMVTTVLAGCAVEIKMVEAGRKKQRNRYLE